MENTEMKPTFKTKIWSVALGSMTAFSVMADKPAAAAADPYIGDVMLIGTNFCPVGWLEANGDLKNISAYDALFPFMARSTAATAEPHSASRICAVESRSVSVKVWG